MHDLCYSTAELWDLFLQHGQRVIEAKWYVFTFTFPDHIEQFFCTGGIFG